MNNISIKSKITLLALVLIGAMALIAVVGLYQLSAVNARLQVLIDVSARAIQYTGELRSDIGNAIREERQAILASSPESAKEIAARSGELQSGVLKQLELLRSTIAKIEDDQTLRGLGSDLEKDVRTLLATSNSVLALAVNKTNSAGAKLLFGDYYQTVTTLADPLRELGQKVPAALDARAKMFRVGLMIADHLQTVGDEDMATLARSIQIEADKLIEYTKQIDQGLVEADRIKYAAIVSSLEKLIPMKDAIIILSTLNSDVRASQISSTKTTEQLEAVNKVLLRINDDLLQRLDLERAGSDRQYKIGFWAILTVGAMGTVLAVFMTFILARSINAAVYQGVDTLGRLSQGDLTARLNFDRRDEVGKLADATDKMSESVSTTVAQIRTLARTLSSSAGELSGVSHDLMSQSHQMSTQAQAVASGTEQLSTNINTMASAAEEMSASIAGISSASEEVSVNVGTISASADQMSRSVVSVQESVRDISQSLTAVARDAKEGSQMTEHAQKLAGEAGTTIQQLESAARDINKVSEVIKMIALQTNLLALNATIEATSAGEAGKGFAVVAGEIKELALQSGQSAEDIARKIEGVQQSTQQAVKAIDVITRLVAQINTSAGRISQAVETQTRSAEQIQVAVTQTRTGIENVARSIAEVAKGTTDMSSSTAEVSRAATDVSRNAAEAARASGHIAGNIHGVSDATGQNTASSTRVNDAARKLIDIASQLEKSVSRFRISGE